MGAIVENQDSNPFVQSRLINPDLSSYPPSLYEAVRTGSKYYFDPDKTCIRNHKGLWIVATKKRDVGPRSQWHALGFTDRVPCSYCYECVKERSRAVSKHRWEIGAYSTNRARALRTHLWESQEGLCAVCFTLLPYKFHVDHIIGIGEGGDPRDLKNVRGLCAPCNLSRKRREKMREPLSRKERAQDELNRIEKRRALLLAVIEDDLDDK